ncbi:MAG: hypothetical protein ACI82F_002487 [Planctomycetota bacterium]|jgi:hypothetical protein
MHERSLHPPRAWILGLALAGSIIWIPEVLGQEADETGTGIEIEIESSQGDAKARAHQEIFERDIQPLITHFCGDCHWGSEAEADVDLMAFGSAAEATADPFLWELVRDQLIAGSMPPSKRPQPQAADTALLLDWISQTLGDGIDLGARASGRTTLRRMNRFEIENAVLDVLGVHIDASEYMPMDEAADGFDTIGSALSFTDAHLNGLFSFAEDVAAAAVPWIDPTQIIERTVKANAFDPGASALRGEYLAFSVEGTAVTEVQFPEAGTFRVDAFARAMQAGDEPAQMRLSVDGKEVAHFQVKQVGQDTVPHSAELTLEEGKHRFEVAFTNDYFDPENEDPSRRDRNLIFSHLVIRGPLSGSVTLQIGLAREAEADLVGTATGLVTSLWRQPPSPSDVERLLAISPPGDPAPIALRNVLIGALASPRFLFRAERDPLGAEARQLDGYELATRLSSFLWSSVPDGALLDKAGRGTLGDPLVLAAEVRRMIADARSSRMVEGFASQWLQLRPLEEHAPDPKRFPDYTPELRRAMQAETEMLFEAVLRENRPISDLLNPGFTFLNERLANHYGVKGVEGTLMRRVTLRDSVRGGLISQASVLTATSYPTRTSPVLRGKWLLEVLLGSAPPPPPQGVPGLSEREANRGPRSLRASFEEHRKNPACAACHDTMDPLGFGLERFDAIGAWRATDNGSPIDSAGLLPDGSSFEGPRALRQLLANDPRYARNLTERLMVYALGRALSPRDRAESRAISDAQSESRIALGELIGGIVGSEAFRTLQAQSTDAEDSAQQTSQPTAPNDTR